VKRRERRRRVLDLLLDLALKIARKILENTNISELSFTESNDQIHGDKFDYDLVITDLSVSHGDIQAVDNILADFDNVEMHIQLDDGEIRVYEVEDIWQGIRRKRILKRAKELRVTPKLSPEVESELRELYQMEAHS